VVLGEVGIGAHVLRATRVDPSSGKRRKWKYSPKMHTAQVRLGSSRLLWAFTESCDKVDPAEVAWQGLEAWKKLKTSGPRCRRHEFPISRNGAVKQSKTIPQPAATAGSTATLSSYIICLGSVVRNSGIGPFILDFGTDAWKAEQWYHALTLMTEPWDEILARADGSVVDDLLKLGLAAVTNSAATTPGASTHGYTAHEYSQQIDSARNPLEAAKETVDGVSGWVETLVKAADISQPVVDGVLTKFSLVGVGFSVLALGLSSSSKVAATYADQLFVSEIRGEIDYIARLMLLEMMKTDAMPSAQRVTFMKHLTGVVAGVEKANALFDAYLLHSTAKNATDGVILRELYGLVEKLRAEVFSLRSSRADLNRGGRIEAAIGTLTKTLSSSLLSSGAKDEFTPTFNAPKNPAGVRLDLSLDANGNPMTMEGELNAAVMRRDMGNIVNAVGSNDVGCMGMGGVGKTCALNGIGREQDVEQRFAGGVYHISLVQNAKSQDVVKQVSAIVKESGGVSLAAVLWDCTKPANAAEIPASWFKGKCCLFICDDL
jgi:hypothetical protein